MLDVVASGRRYGAILADPPWRFRTWNKQTVLKPRWGPRSFRDASIHYKTMPIEEIRALPVRDIAADDCVLFLWISWPQLIEALSVIEAWGFAYKTCAFDWLKAHAGQLEMFDDDMEALMGMGFWTRANGEPCLLATRGDPKRKDRGVRMGIIEPRRQHSRKPDCVRERIERLVDGPYIELFSRSDRAGWDSWGDEVGKFQEVGSGTAIRTEP